MFRSTCLLVPHRKASAMLWPQCSALSKSSTWGRAELLQALKDFLPLYRRRPVGFYPRCVVPFYCIFFWFFSIEINWAIAFKNFSTPNFRNFEFKVQQDFIVLLPKDTPLLVQGTPPCPRDNPLSDRIYFHHLLVLYDKL